MRASVSSRASVAPSLDRVEYSRIREIAEIALAMDGVLRLYFGESSEPTPDFIKQAAVRALADGYTFYSENAGLPSLREALAGYYAEHHHVSLDPATEITVTASGVQALSVAIRCVIDPGDEALVLTPVWPNGPAAVLMYGGTVRELPMQLDGPGYRIDFDALERAITRRTRLLLVTSPSNPLGWVAEPDEQARLLDVARQHGLWLLADEVYERLWYGQETPGTPAPSILRLATREDAVLVVQSFSKTYCMTGWRVGWLVGRRDAAVKAAQLNEYVVSHAPTFLQKAAEVALAEGEPFVRGMVAELEQKRRVCLDALRQIPDVIVPEPEGAFYLFPRIEGLADSFALCRRLLAEHGVGLAPGAAFGAGGEGSLRLCYAAERGVLDPALERLAAFLAAGRVP